LIEVSGLFVEHIYPEPLPEASFRFRIPRPCTLILYFSSNKSIHIDFGDETFARFESERIEHVYEVADVDLKIYGDVSHLVKLEII